MRRPAEVFPPGEFLREELEARNWRQADFAEILGRPLRTVNEIIAGKRGITPETAKGIAAALGTSPELWLNLEASYQLWRSRSDDDGAVARRAKIYNLAPVADMVRRGWIEPTDDVEVLEQRILAFFEIKSLDETPETVGFAARKTIPKASSYEHLSPPERAWLFRAKRLARAVQVGKFSRDELLKAVERLRLLLHVPQEIRHVPRILAEAGVRFLLVQALPNTKIDGACFWIDHAPVIAMTLRFDRIDNFWFTLFHEIAHALAGETSLDSDLVGERGDDGRPDSEKAADGFAVKTLIPTAKLESFIRRVRPLYSTKRIEAFAQTMGVHPGIVVGQLQNRREVSWASFRQLLTPIRGWLDGSALTDGWGNMLPAFL